MSLTTKFYISITIGKQRQKYFLSIYWKNCNGKIRNEEKNKTVKWHVTFTNDITDRINSMVKHVHKYAEEKTSSIYAKGIMEGITVGFKKDKSYDDMIFVPIKLFYWSFHQ